MAEEVKDLPPGEEEAGPAAPETQQQDEPQDEPTVEELARQAGWTPKEDFRGNPEKWKPAHEYLRVEKDRVSSLGKKLKSVEDQLARMAQAQEFVVQTTLRDRDAYWQARMQEAFEAGDSEGYRVAQEQRSKLQEVAPVTQGPPPEAQEFAERHKSWFGSHPMATYLAHQTCEAWAKAGHPASKQLEEAEREVRKAYPELFPAAASKPPASVNAPQERTHRSGRGKKGFSDLPREAQEAALKFEREHGVPKDDYAANYWKRIERTA